MTRVDQLLNWDSAENALIAILERHSQRDNLRTLVAGEAIILVRNWYGKLTLLLPCTKDELTRSSSSELLEDLHKTVGELALSPWSLCRDELFDGTSYWNDPALIQLFQEDVQEQPLTLLLLERQDKERDWLIPPSAPVISAKHSKRCVFFSVKGGGGRSSALTMLAISLATLGKRVLVVDGDFESPGLSSSLLPVDDGQPEYGVVDWLTAEALGADASALKRMSLETTVASSPLNTRLELQGQVLVAPAYGCKTEAYVSKLARIYRHSPEGKPYAQRLNEFLSMTESAHKIDITLFDCRAGIDDTAAAAVTQLQADVSFLFAINTSQTWDSYRLLFKHLKRNPALFTNEPLEGRQGQEEPWELRRSLRLVSALTPQEYGPYVGYFEALKQNAYETFSEIYDADSGEENQVFSPSPEDLNAPHAALRIQWVEALRAFSPLTEPNQVTDPLNQAAFSDFLNRALTLLGVDDEQRR